MAVTTNLEGTQAADRIEEERPNLPQRGITFTVWDETEISTLVIECRAARVIEVDFRTAGSVGFSLAYKAHWLEVR
ncbi:MAG: hypothetical protein ACRDSE_03265 [Pseudonocardiaceae bacterium]